MYAAYQRTKLALRLESVIAARAKANQVAGGGDQKSGSQKSDNPIQRVDTRAEIAKIAGVSHDTVAKRRLADEYDSAQDRGEVGAVVGKVTFCPFATC